MPHPEMPKGPFRLSEINRKVREGQEITPAEREFRNACYRRYEPGRVTFRTRPEWRAEWQAMAEARGMSESQWYEERILTSLRPEDPKLRELREQLEAKTAEVDLQRKQFSDLALERARDQDLLRDLEREIRGKLAEELRRRGA